MKNGMHLEADGCKVWYKNNELHREDGPAIEWKNGDKNYYLNNKLAKWFKIKHIIVGISYLP